MVPEAARLALALLGTVSIATGSGGVDEVHVLAEKKRRLERQVALLRLETPLARTRQAYAVLNLQERRILFRVRGRTMKEYPIQGYRIRSHGRAALDGVHRLEDLIGREIPVELPGSAGNDPDAAAGLSMIAPDPPPRFLWRFGGGVSVYVRDAGHPSEGADRQVERVAALAKGIGRFWDRLLRRSSRPPGLEIAVTGEDGRGLYRSLLVGQSLIVVGPSARAPGPAGAPASLSTAERKSSGGGET